MKNFEIYPYEKRKVQFAVIAPHFDGLVRAGNVIERIMAMDKEKTCN